MDNLWARKEGANLRSLAGTCALRGCQCSRQSWLQILLFRRSLLFEIEALALDALCLTFSLTLLRQLSLGFSRNSPTIGLNYCAALHLFFGPALCFDLRLAL
ncbi:hypothetical protein C2U70_20365 [Bradyrhizobium guangdongense]|nr:hypothetical protein C2U70_20365 [Bradyrhizobium guangdongense]